MCRLTERLASRHEPFVVGNIMKGRFTPGNPHEPSRARHLIDHVPLHRGLQQHVQHRQHVVDRLRRLRHEPRLQASGVLRSDRIKAPGPKGRNQVHPQHRLLASDPARLVVIGSRVAINEPWSKLLQSGHLLFWISGRGLQEARCTTFDRSRSSAGTTTILVEAYGGSKAVGDCRTVCEALAACCELKRVADVELIEPIQVRIPATRSFAVTFR